MKDGFIKVAACTPEIQVADVDFNVDKIISQLEKCREEGVKVAVFPELCITCLLYTSPSPRDCS